MEYNKDNIKVNAKGDWGLGIGDWGLQSPIPNPQSPNVNFNYLLFISVS